MPASGEGVAGEVVAGKVGDEEEGAGKGEEVAVLRARIVELEAALAVGVRDGDGGAGGDGAGVVSAERAQERAGREMEVRQQVEEVVSGLLGATAVAREAENEVWRFIEFLGQQGERVEQELVQAKEKAKAEAARMGEEMTSLRVQCAELAEQFEDAVQIAEHEASKAREYKTRLGQVGDLEVEVEMLRAKCASLTAEGGGGAAAAGGEAGTGGEGDAKGGREAELEAQLKSARLAVREMEEESVTAMNERSVLQKKERASKEEAEALAVKYATLETVHASLEEAHAALRAEHELCQATVQQLRTSAEEADRRAAESEAQLNCQHVLIETLHRDEEAAAAAVADLNEQLQRLQRAAAHAEAAGDVGELREAVELLRRQADEAAVQLADGDAQLSSAAAVLESLVQALTTALEQASHDADARREEARTLAADRERIGAELERVATELQTATAALEETRVRADALEQAQAAAPQCGAESAAVVAGDGDEGLGGSAQAPAQYTPSVEELQAELRVALDELGVRTEALEAARRQQTSLQDRVVETEAKLSAAEGDLTLAVSERAAAQEALELVEREVGRLRAQNAELEGKEQEREKSGGGMGGREEVARLEQLVKVAEAEREDAVATAERLETELRAARDELVTRTEALETSHQQQTSLQDRLVETETRLSAAEGDLALAVSERAAAQEALELVEREVGRLRAQNAELEGKEQDREASGGGMGGREEVARLEQLVKVAEAEREDAVETAERLVVKVSGLEEELELLRLDLEIAHEELALQASPDALPGQDGVSGGGEGVGSGAAGGGGGQSTGEQDGGEAEQLKGQVVALTQALQRVHAQYIATAQEQEQLKADLELALEAADEGERLRAELATVREACTHLQEQVDAAEDVSAIVANLTDKCAAQEERLTEQQRALAEQEEMVQVLEEVEEHQVEEIRQLRLIVAARDAEASQHQLALQTLVLLHIRTFTHAPTHNTRTHTHIDTHTQRKRERATGARAYTPATALEPLGAAGQALGRAAAACQRCTSLPLPPAPQCSNEMPIGNLKSRSNELVSWSKTGNHETTQRPRPSVT